jgi:hypothetical protein
MGWQSIHSWRHFFRPPRVVPSSEHINDLGPLVPEGTVMLKDRHDNLTPAQCRTLADRYKAEAKQAGISEKRAAVSMNIARTYSGLASQLEILAVDKGEK